VRALVTGASGFVGRHLVAHLQAEGDTVVGLDRNGPAPTDITDAEAVRLRVSDVQPDAVYHLGGFSDVGGSWSTPNATFRVNAEGTLNVIALPRDWANYGEMLDTFTPVKGERAPMTSSSWALSGAVSKVTLAVVSRPLRTMPSLAVPPSALVAKR